MLYETNTDLALALLQCALTGDVINGTLCYRIVNRKLATINTHLMTGSQSQVTRRLNDAEYQAVLNQYCEMHGINERLPSEVREHIQDYIEYVVVPEASTKAGAEPVNYVELATMAANDFGHDEWMDDPSHWVWDIAYNVHVTY